MAESTTTQKASLPKEVFAVEVPNHELVKLAYDAYLSNSRLASATTKQRGEVRGGGKKPWKQKGTGRARFGSSRNPIWRGGGIVFGPRGNENYTKKLSKASKRKAVAQALTLANEAKKIIVKDEKTPELIRATNNLQQVRLVSAMYLNVYDILNADVIVMSDKSIAVVKQWLTGEEA